MRNLLSDVIRALAVVGAGCTINVAMAQSTESHRVKATLVSQESSLHTSVSNRDVYILRVIPRSGVAFDATVVDIYPAYAQALPLHGLSRNMTFSVKLIRTPYCDLTTSDDGQGVPIPLFRDQARQF